MSRRNPESPVRHTPYEYENRASVRAKGYRNRPTTLRDLLFWLTTGYALEGPVMLHERDELAADGDPEHTGETKGWLGMNYPAASQPQAQPTDWTRVACRRDEDGSYLTPIRCAIARIGDPDRRTLLGGLAVNLLTPLDVTRAQDIPDWCAGDVMFRSLDQLWSVYEDRPLPVRTPGWVSMSESQRAAIEDGEQPAA